MIELAACIRFFGSEILRKLKYFVPQGWGICVNVSPQGWGFCCIVAMFFRQNDKRPGRGRGGGGGGQPHSQALPSCLRKDPGWGWSRVSRKFDRPRGSRQSIKLHASTFELYTSIARSECFVPINFENHIYFKILA